MIPFPGEKYQIIYADPPWAYQQGGRGAAKNHYPTMTTEELCNLPVEEITRGGLPLSLGNFPNAAGGSARYGGVGVFL